jgi:hypothetical protein
MLLPTLNSNNTKRNIVIDKNNINICKSTIAIVVVSFYGQLFLSSQT